MNEHCNTTEAIEVAIASLNGLASIQIIDGLQLHVNRNWWSIKCRLTIQSIDTSLVPNETDWYVTFRNTYPRGAINLIPAKENSIEKTFQHQYYNGQGFQNEPWRNGIICAKSGFSWLKKRGYDTEPFEPENRLKWHLEQALNWLTDAASGNLVTEGGLFEFPDYNTTDKLYTISFCESEETFGVWEPILNRTGIVELGLLKKPENTLITISFKDHMEQLLYAPPWNENIKNKIIERQAGVWGLVPQVVVLPPWQVPMTWGELRNALDNQNVNYSEMIARVPRFLRDGRHHFLMLGFPVSNKIGEPPTQIHWQTLLLPVLSHGTITANGFRTNERGYLMRDRKILSANEPLDWQKSNNWHSNEILNRGRYGEHISEAKVVIVGGGAFGSIVSEMLVRAGAQHIILIDHEKIEIGNLTRHTLDLDSIGELKTEVLKKRLMGISPYVEVHSYPNKLEKLDQTSINAIKEANIVLDCTGNDDILYCLEQFSWDRRPTFCSISIGLQARRLYVLVSQRRKFPVAFYMRHIKKWLHKDLDEYDGEELPQSGGVGCWHPAFPARIDDINLFASTALKYLDSYMKSSITHSKLGIFEQVQDESCFCGINFQEECDNG